MENLIWNYKAWDEREQKCFFFTQEDWNQTLITRFNEIHATHYRGEANLIKVPEKFRRIVESMEYYANNKLGSFYTIEFIKSDENKIYVDDHFVEILNYE